MKILVIGNGAREHAIAEAFRRSKYKPHVIVSPGNPGIAREFETEQLETFEDIEDYCIIQGIDLVFIGPEKPLADGLADHLRNQNIKAIGPSKAAAKLETSKSFAKDIMARLNIPTAKYEVYHSYETAYESLSKWSFPIVIKADGLAAGKGVYIAHSPVDADKILHKVMIEKIYGSAGEKVVFEEYLEGWEVSLFAFTDGEGFATTLFCQDHKQLYDGDRGPNTGGMGAFAPVLEAEIFRTDIEKEIISPILNYMQQNGIPYQGVLYLGLILTKDGPKVLEFNCRMGDPETQTILPLLETDFVDVCQAILHKQISALELKWSHKTAVCVVLAGKEYPTGKNSGNPIMFTAHVDSHVFFSGVGKNENELITDGGRIMSVTALGLSVAEARAKVYHDINKIFFEGMHFRTDIGLRENIV